MTERRDPIGGGDRKRLARLLIRPILCAAFLVLAVTAASAAKERASMPKPVPAPLQDLPASLPDLAPPAVPVAGPAAAAPDGPIVAHHALVAGDLTRTRFVMDLSGQTALSVFTLDEPYRVVIDLPEVHFDLEADAGAKGKGLVSAFRYGLISPGKSRIVLDARNPVSVDKAFVLPASANQPARLVIDLVTTTKPAFETSLQAYRDKSGPAPAPAVSNATPNAADGKLRVVIDPGHGGIDSGAIGKSGTLEKNVVLAFARTLKDKLSADGRYEVIMTREDDTFVPLGGRVSFARAHHADLFISVHADSFWGTDVRGATVYTLSDKASDKMAAQIAESENKSDILAGVDVPEDTSEVSDILVDLARRETKSFAVVFARNMIKELKPDVQLFKRAHQQAGFVVLKAPDVPSALVELGYLSNAFDEKLLTSESWRDKTATAAARAVDDYFRTRVAVTTDPSMMTTGAVEQ